MRNFKVILLIVLLVLSIFFSTFYYAFAQESIGGEWSGFGGSIYGPGSMGPGGIGPAGPMCPPPPPPPGPGGDHPDETQSVGILAVPEVFYLSEIADCMILLNPDIPYKNFTSLLSTFKVPVIYTDINSSASILQEVHNKVLIIPTGGLYGLERSDILKANLDEFVKQGGILVVFAQQRGYEFNVLPGGVSGYGWVEDQSCQAQAAQIDEYHQILSGQKDLRFDGGIDGFFMQWPENTKILLRRTKNNMPALILYPYGSGYVIATTLYSDYSFAQGSITEDELALIKDIITWCKNPKEYVEAKPNEEIRDWRLEIRNDTDKDANKVKFSIKYQVSSVKEETIDLVVPAGQTITYNYTFTVPQELGIYSIYYSLMADSESLMTNIFADNFAKYKL